MDFLFTKVAQAAILPRAISIRPSAKQILKAEGGLLTAESSFLRGTIMRLVITLFVLLLPMVPTFLAIRDVVYRPFDDPQKKMIWLLIIIFLPVLGGLIYFAFKIRRKTADKIG